MSAQVEEPITSLATLQFAWGGLFNSKPADNYAVHLVRQREHGGTPGPTLCGIDRFSEGGPGWCVGGGMTGPRIVHIPCAGCAQVAQSDFPGLPIAGRVGAKEMRAIIKRRSTHEHLRAL